MSIVTRLRKKQYILQNHGKKYLLTNGFFPLFRLSYLQWNMHRRFRSDVKCTSSEILQSGFFYCISRGTKCAYRRPLEKRTFIRHEHFVCIDTREKWIAKRIVATDVCIVRIFH